MVLVRVWRRRMLGGMGMAMIVPGTLLAALALLALAGGFGGIAALGQAFSGPSVPGATLGGSRGAVAGRAVPPALVAVLSARAIGGRPAAATQVASSAPATAPGSGASTPPAPAAPRGGGGSGPRQSGGASGTPMPPPKPQPTVVDRVVSAGTSVTSQVPAPVGPAATKALQQAGSTLDSIVPIKAP